MVPVRGAAIRDGHCPVLILDVSKYMYEPEWNTINTLVFTSNWRRGVAFATEQAEFYGQILVAN